MFKKMLGEFKEFAMRGSVVDLAVGIIIGGAFGTIVASLVKDVIMPPIGVLLGGVDFSDIRIPLRAAAPGQEPVAMNIGVFLNNLIAFLMVTAVMFFLIRTMSRLEQSLESKFGDVLGPDEPTDKKCPYCRTTIPFKACRCPNCTSDLKVECEQPEA